MNNWRATHIYRALTGIYLNQSALYNLIRDGKNTFIDG